MDTPSSSPTSAVVADRRLGGAAARPRRPLDGCAHASPPSRSTRPSASPGLVIIGPAYRAPLPTTRRSPTGTGSRTGSRAAGWRASSRAYEASDLDPRVARDAAAHHPRADRPRTATPRPWRRRCARCRARVPFEDLGELEFLDVPALVVASHDEADPGHPYAVAEAYAERLPQARLVSEEPGRIAARLAGRAAVARDRRVLRAPEVAGCGSRPSGGSRAGARAAGPTRSRRSRRPCCRRGRVRARSRARRPR